MQIGGSFPINIARAYNLAQPGKGAQVGPATQPSEAKPIDKLIAGKTNQPVEFDATPPNSIASGEALQLYTRAADRIEAATGIALGKSLDVTG